MSTTISPNMGLIVPTTGSEPGPDFANDVNASLGTIDQHNHASGNGVQITPTGLNINTDLTFQGNNGISLRTIHFSPLANTGLLTASDNGSVSEIGVDLYYRDGNGNNIRMTQSGSIAGTSGSITNLVSPASVTYVSGTPAFVFQSDVATPANLDGGSLVIRNILANSKGITINPPAALANNYSVTFPASLPGSIKFLTIDSSGNLGATIYVDNSTITVPGGVMQVPAGAITSTQLANGAVTLNKLAASAADGTSLQVSGGVMSLINGGFTRGVDFSFTTTTFGNVYGSAPSFTSQSGHVRITLMPRADAVNSFLQMSTSGSASTCIMALTFTQNGVACARTSFEMNLNVSATATYQSPVGQSFIVPATIGSSISYNLFVSITSNASGGTSCTTIGCLYMEDVTY